MLDKSKPITILCPEGFAYVAWQRVVCMQDNNNVTEEIFKLMEGDENEFNQQAVDYNDARMFYSDGSMFVLSGESFSLEDFAEVIREEIGCKVIAIDGDEDAPTQPTKCEECGYPMEMFEFEGEARKKLTCTHCGWRRPSLRKNLSDK